MTGNTEKILVIKLGALGDFIQALGPMAAIRRHHPDAHITLMTTRPFLELAQASGYFDVIWIDEKPKWKQPLKWLRLRRTLKDQSFGRVYDLQNNDRTQIYFNLLPKPKPEWIGAARGASHRNISPKRTEGAAFDGHVQTLALAGIHNVGIDRLDWIEGNPHYTGLKPPFVLLVPGSAPNRPQKRWPPQHYANLARQLLNHGYQPVLIGTEDEQVVLDTITHFCPEALDLGGKTSLFDIVALARQAAGAIGNDTGPMHMIAPTGLPSIVLFSSDSNPSRHAPKGHDVVTIQKDSLEDLSPARVWNAFAFQQGIS